MSSRRFTAPFLVSLVVCGQLVFLPSETLARCCGLCNCWMQMVYGSQYCYCGGDCPSGCATDDDLSPLRIHSPNDKIVADAVQPPKA